MDIQKLIPQILLNGILQDLHLTATIAKSDLAKIIDFQLKEQLSQIDKLPDGISIDYKHLNQIHFNDKIISSTSELTILADKILLPKHTDIIANIGIELALKDQYLQLIEPKINIDMVEENWKNKMLNVIVDQLVGFQKNKIADLLDSKVNNRLSGIQKVQEMSIDYAVHELSGKSSEREIILSFGASAFLNIERTLEKENSGVTAMLDPKVLFPILLTQINKDISEKVEQDVELLELEVIELNKLRARGRVGVMGIKKEFDVFATIIFDKVEQKISLKVDDIDIGGGFLVRKGFEVVEPKIRGMIEKSVQIPIKKLLTETRIPIKLPMIEDKYLANLSGISITDIAMTNQGDYLIFILELENFEVSIELKAIQE